MNYSRKILLVITLIGLGVGLYFVYLFNRTFFWDNTVFSEEQVFVYIHPGDDFRAVQHQMGTLLGSITDFSRAAEKKGYTSRVKSGKFAILKGSNNNEIVNTLRSGGQTVRVTFNNQERIENLAGRIAEQIAPDSLDLLNAFLDPHFLQEKGLTSDQALGIYLPNSYDIFWNSSATQFRDKMWEAYQDYWNEARKEKARLHSLSPIEVISLAAIVQKETQKVDERPRVAGVYLNRLKKGMRLQADPTVIYALKRKYQNFDTLIKRVLYKDLTIESTYNTYQNRGLPPGPIAMPDLSSIAAVLQPERHDFLYFVANPNRPGYHLFAKNGREHARNKKIYTRWLNRNKVFR